MTKEEEILAMEAGGDLDALIAEDILGLRIEKHYLGGQLCNIYVKGTRTPILEYSTYISAAWQVEEKIKELGLTEQYGNKIAIIVLDDNATARQRIFDAAHASPEMRCKAALLAILTKKEE